MGAGTEATELSWAAGLAALGAALLLAFCALHATAKNWLVDYYPNPSFEGDARTTAWIRRVSLDVPGDFLLGRVPDRVDFSLRFRSCLPISEPTDLAIRLTANDRARMYVDGRLVVDTAELPPAQESVSGRKKSKRAKAKQHVDLTSGTHLLTLEYTNTEGSGALLLQLSQPGVRDSSLQSRLRRPDLNGRCDTI